MRQINRQKHYQGGNYGLREKVQIVLKMRYAQWDKITGKKKKNISRWLLRFRRKGTNYDKNATCPMRQSKRQKNYQGGCYGLGEKVQIAQKTATCPIRQNNR